MPLIFAALFVGVGAVHALTAVAADGDGAPDRRHQWQCTLGYRLNHVKSADYSNLQQFGAPVTTTKAHWTIDTQY